jgi:hypothetical protein
MRLLAQILAAALVAGLLPLLLITYSALAGYNRTGQEATDAGVQLLDDTSFQALRGRIQRAPWRAETGSGCQHQQL